MSRQTQVRVLARARMNDRDYGRKIARRRQLLLTSIGALVWWMHSEGKKR